MIPLKTTGIELHETIGGSAAQRETMLRLYAEIFPEYAYYLPYMAHKMTQQIDSDPAFIERWWLIEVEGQAAGLNYIKYAPKRNCGFILSTGILPQFRKVQVGRHPRLLDYLLELTIEQTEADAAMLGCSPPAGIVAEFQRPEPEMSAEEQAWHQHIIDRYASVGFVDLGVDYYEPPHIVGAEQYLPGINPSEQKFHHMLLSMLPLNGSFDPNDAETITQAALMVLVDHYKLPENHWAVKTALQSIANRHGNLQHE